MNNDFSSEQCQCVQRWQSRGNRYWVELYRDNLGYSYRGDSCSGNIGNCTEEVARAFIQQRIIETALNDGIKLIACKEKSC